MRKADEILLYNTLRETRPGPYEPCAPWPNEVAGMIGMHFNRMFYLLDKWADKGYWEYGVSLRCGWFTEAAPERLAP